MKTKLQQKLTSKATRCIEFELPDEWPSCAHWSRAKAHDDAYLDERELERMAEKLQPKIKRAEKNIKDCIDNFYITIVE